MKWLPLGIALLLVLMGYDSVFEVHEGQRALLRQFGTIRPQEYHAGLHLKWPLVQQVVRLDRRIQAQSLPLHTYRLADQPVIETSALLHWRIEDDALFYRQAGGDPLRARRELAALTTQALEAILQQRSLHELVADPASVGASATAQLNAPAAHMGLKLLDVAVKEIQLPEAQLTAIYHRMQNEQTAAIDQLRISGAAEAKQIRFKADQQAAAILADASQRIARMQGEGEAKIATLYAEAATQDPAFFDFYRGLQAYREAFGKGGNVWILTPENSLLPAIGGAHGAYAARP